MKIMKVADAKSRPFPAMDVIFQSASYMYNLPRNLVPDEYWHEGKGLPGIYFQYEEGDPFPSTWEWFHLATRTVADFLLENGSDEATIRSWLPQKIVVIPAFNQMELEVVIQSLKDG